MVSTVRIYWYILKTAIVERLTYRADFALGTLMRFLPIVTQIFLWGAIFGVQSQGAASSDAETVRINGYTYQNMVAYYLLAMVGRAFSSMPGLASSLAREVRDGTVKKYLTQPVDLLAYYFWARVAHKAVYYGVAIGPFALVFWLCRSFFPGWPDAPTLAAFAVSCLCAFLLGFLIESLIGLMSFWLLEVSSLIFIFMMLNYFLSGHMVPLDWLVDWLGRRGGPWAQLFGQALMYLPFQYLAYFPSSVMLGKYTHAELLRHCLLQVAWVLALWGLNRVMLQQGLRRYSAYGG